MKANTRYRVKILYKLKIISLDIGKSGMMVMMPRKRYKKPPTRIHLVRFLHLLLEECVPARIEELVKRVEGGETGESGRAWEIANRLMKPTPGQERAAAGARAAI